MNFQLFWISRYKTPLTSDFTQRQFLHERCPSGAGGRIQGFLLYSPARTESTLSALLLVRNSRSTSHAAGQPGATWGSKVFKKAVGAQCADRRYMGSDIFYQLGPLTRLGDLLACRCRRLDRQGFLRKQSRFLWLRLRAFPWLPSCGRQRIRGRCRRRSSS